MGATFTQNARPQNRHELSHFGKCDALFELDNPLTQSLLCICGAFQATRRRRTDYH